MKGGCIMKTLKEIAVAKGLDIALEYLDRDIERNLPKLVDWAESLNQRQHLRKN